MRLILDTTFLLWRPPKIFTHHGGKIEQNHIFQNLTSTCKDPSAANHTISMVTPQLFIFVLVQKNIYTYSLSAFCTRLLTSFPAEIWFFKISDRGCRTKGPLPNLGRLTVFLYLQNASSERTGGHLSRMEDNWFSSRLPAHRGRHREQTKENVLHRKQIHTFAGECGFFSCIIYYYHSFSMSHTPGVILRSFCQMGKHWSKRVKKHWLLVSAHMVSWTLP